MNLTFEKWVGAGNDFIFLTPIENLDLSLLPKLSIDLCNRNFGIGADGLVFIELLDEDQKHFRWHFFNSDGSSAEMCGNAARCAVGFIKNHWNTEECQLETLAGTLKGQWIDQSSAVSFDLNNSLLEERSFEISEDRTITGYYTNTGVPHFVILNSSGQLSLADCLEIQSHESFGEAQTNVTLLDIAEDDKQYTKSFERGVRNFTLACGTGVIASALVLQHLNNNNKQELIAPGGVLQVEINSSNVTLIGPAVHVYNGSLIDKQETD